MSPPGIGVALRGEVRSLTRQPLSPGSCVRIADGALVTLGGVGPERARAAGAALLASGASALVSWGTAAGLDPRLAPGALVVPAWVLGMDGSVSRVDGAWHGRLCHRLSFTLEVHTGPIVEARGLLGTPGEKQALFERHGALAADMESAALARLAAERGVPFLAVRAVLDPAGGRVPGWVAGMFGGPAGIGARRLVAPAAAHPGDWPLLVRLGFEFRAARRTLMRVVAQAGTTLLAP